MLLESDEKTESSVKSLIIHEIKVILEKKKKKNPNLDSERKD